MRIFGISTSVLALVSFTSAATAQSAYAENCSTSSDIIDALGLNGLGIGANVCDGLKLTFPDLFQEDFHAFDIKKVIHHIMTDPELEYLKEEFRNGLLRLHGMPENHYPACDNFTGENIGSFTCEA